MKQKERKDEAYCSRNPLIPVLSIKIDHETARQYDRVPPGGAVRRVSLSQGCIYGWKRCITYLFNFVDYILTTMRLLDITLCFGLVLGFGMSTYSSWK